MKSPDLLAGFNAGTFPPLGWEVEARRNANEAAEKLLRALGGTLLMITSALVLALGVLWASGKLSPDLPVSWSKVLSTAGGFLAAWATLFELAGVPQTWSGESLHEEIHPAIFCAIFLPGLLLAFLGQML